jgi:chromosome segregation ATPase
LQERFSLESVLADVSHQLKEIRERENLLEKDLEESMDECDTIRADSEILQHELHAVIADRDRELEEQREHLAEFENEISIVKEERARLVADCRQESEELATVQFRLFDVSMQLADSIGRENLLLKELQEGQEEFELSKAESEKLRKDLKDELSDREHQLEKQRECSLIFDSAVAELKEECARLVSGNEDVLLESKLADTSKKLEEVMVKEDVLSTELQNTKNELASMKAD